MKQRGPAATRPAKVYDAWPFDANEASRGQQETADAMGVPKKTALNLGNGLAMKLILIPAGKFLMGNPESKKEHISMEGPRHEVAISQPFYMGIYTVTQGQYEQVMGQNPSEGSKRAGDPVNAASCLDAMTFCKKVSQAAGRTVRLPTEAEWEYACRAGTQTAFFYGDDDRKKGEYSGYLTIPDATSQPASLRKPNAWGLYGLYGHVRQWCSDRWAETYAGAKNVDPTGPETGSYRVVRGGSHLYGGVGRSSARAGVTDYHRRGFVGFRVVVACFGDAPPAGVVPASGPATRRSDAP